MSAILSRSALTTDSWTLCPVWDRISCPRVHDVSCPGVPQIQTDSALISWYFGHCKPSAFPAGVSVSLVGVLNWVWTCHHKARNAFGFCGLWPRDEWLLLVVLQHRVLHVLWRGEMLRRRVEQTLLSQGDTRPGHGELKRREKLFLSLKGYGTFMYIHEANKVKEWIHQFLCAFVGFHLLNYELRMLSFLRWST